VVLKWCFFPCAFDACTLTLHRLFEVECHVSLFSLMSSFVAKKLDIGGMPRHPKRDGREH